MHKCKYGRHAPSFILLFLVEGPCYGSTLLAKMEQELPYNPMDSAAIYRALKDLERAGAVSSYWDTSKPGPAKKWYHITDTGFTKLAEFKEEIEKRKKNLEFFLQKYQQLADTTGGAKK